MANTYNAPARVERNQEFGAVWVEKYSNQNGTLEVPKFSAVRVKGGASGCTVTIDGVLAATLAATEILIFNVGAGTNSDTKRTVSVAISANSWVQVALNEDPTKEGVL